MQVTYMLFSSRVHRKLARVRIGKVLAIIGILISGNRRESTAADTQITANDRAAINRL